MQFLYHQDAGKSALELKNEAFKHLKARRIKPLDELVLRNLNDEIAYIYEVKELFKNSCSLALKSTQKSAQSLTKTRLALAIIEPKMIEKMLPFLNELGLFGLVLVYTEFSQRHFNPDLERLKRILIESCQQCGRTNLMQIEIYKDTKSFLKDFKSVILLDFEGEDLNESALKDEANIFFVGPEGGFSVKERALFERKMKFQSPFILRSQSAAMALAAKILL